MVDLSLPHLANEILHWLATGREVDERSPFKAEIPAETSLEVLRGIYRSGEIFSCAWDEEQPWVAMAAQGIGRPSLVYARGTISEVRGHG